MLRTRDFSIYQSWVHELSRRQISYRLGNVYPYPQVVAVVSCTCS